MEIRFWPLSAYSFPTVSNRLTAGSLPTQRTIAPTPKINSTATAARVRFDNAELPANANMAISEARAEIIPMRDREKTSAANVATARNSKNTKGSNSLADNNWRAFTSPRLATRTTCRLRARLALS